MTDDQTRRGRENSGKGAMRTVAKESGKNQKSHSALESLIKERTLDLSETNRQLRKTIFDLYNIFELSRNFNALLDYQSLLDSFILAAMGRLGASRAALYLPRKIGEKHFHLARAKGTSPFPESEIEIDPEGPFGRYITALNRPVMVNDVRDKFAAEEDLRFIEYFPHGLVIPLVFQTKLRGVLIISGRGAGVMYPDSDIEFLSILANQTAVSIENARLYESEKEALNKLQQAQEKLVQSEKSAALGELSAKVAHEINNPLGIIKNYLFLATKHFEEPEKAEQYMGIVRQEIDRIAAIVRQLLDFHRPVIIRFAQVEPQKIIREILGMMKYQMDDSRVTVDLQVDDNVPVIKAWPEGLKQVLMNLLVNAREAMSEGGHIKIAVTSIGKRVSISIQDSGPGIPEDNIPHIFDSFFTTKGEKGGTGLGLSVCKRIIKNHRGSISYKNTETGGCFIIELPVEQKDAEYDWRI